MAFNSYILIKENGGEAMEIIGMQTGEDGRTGDC